LYLRLQLSCCHRSTDAVEQIGQQVLPTVDPLRPVEPEAHVAGVAE
jgi:hypothetical protein